MLILTSTIWGECWLNKNTFLMTYVAWHSIVIPFITIKITHYLSERFLLYSTAQMGTKQISKRTLILAFSLPLRSSPKLLFFLMKPCLFLFWRRMSGCYLMKTFRNKYKYKEKTVFDVIWKKIEKIQSLNYGMKEKGLAWNQWKFFCGILVCHGCLNFTLKLWIHSLTRSIHQYTQNSSWHFRVHKHAKTLLWIRC